MLRPHLHEPIIPRRYTPMYGAGALPSALSPTKVGVRSKTSAYLLDWDTDMHCFALTFVLLALGKYCSSDKYLETSFLAFRKPDGGFSKSLNSWSVHLSTTP